MIPSITHPAGELLVRKLHEGAATIATLAAQLDGLARSLINETDSQSGLDGFRTAFGDQADAALGCVTGFRHLYASLAGHDVPPLQGQAELALPAAQLSETPTAGSDPADGAAAPSAGEEPSAAPAATGDPDPMGSPAQPEPSEEAATDPGDTSKTKGRRK